MPFYCEIDEDNFSYQFKSTIDRNQARNTMSEWLHIIMGLLKEIWELYQDIIEKTGKISGQERSQLVDKLDELFNSLLVLQRTMHENIPPQLVRSLELKPRISVIFNLNNFSSHGTLKEQDMHSITGFDAAYNEKLIPGIKELLLKYKRLAETGQSSTVADFQSVFNVFDEIFYQLLILRYNLVNCVIDR